LGGNEDINDEYWKKIVSDVDSNGDGEVSLEEFITIMQKIIDP